MGMSNNDIKFSEFSVFSEDEENRGGVNSNCTGLTADTGTGLTANTGLAMDTDMEVTLDTCVSEHVTEFCGCMMSVV